MIKNLFKLPSLFCLGFIIGGYPCYKCSNNAILILGKQTNMNSNDYKNNQLESRFNR